MSVSNMLRGVAALTLVVAMFGSAHAVLASGAAPGMDGVREVVLQPVLFDDPKASDLCGLSREDVMHVMLDPLLAAKVPATPANDTQPPMIGVARIDLNTEIYTINNGDLDCTSWVEVTVSSKNSVSVPPIEVPRSVVVQYWHQGTMVSGGQSIHQHSVDGTLQKMMQQFGKQYQLDQPLPLH